jgi:histidinol-phosphate/aromatic aminotransferase/cobyric acid decarboxylase-like protein
MSVVARAPAPGSHGGDGARLAQALGVPIDEVLDLSASLNPVAPDIRRTVEKHLGALSRYPDPANATAALAEVMGVSPETLVLTNGGAEGIALVAGDAGAGWVEDPDFALYKRHLAVLDPLAPRWRSNPNNPTGLLAARHETAGVWDEAFWQLATGTWTRGDARSGSVVVGSLTKLLACPGLRIGYVLCPDDVTASRLLARQPQWSLNGIAASVLPDLLEDVDLPRWSRQVAGLQNDLAGVLTEAGLEPRQSDANWLLVDAPTLRDDLAQHAILVRDCGSFGMPGTARIAVASPQRLERLAIALGKTREASQS